MLIKPTKLEHARVELLKSISLKNNAVEVPLEKASERISNKKIDSKLNLPSTANSAVDGYGISSATFFDNPNNDANIEDIMMVVAYNYTELLKNVSDFNQLVNKLDSYNGYCTNTSNLNLGYIYKKTLNIDSIYTILNSENYFFAGRFPLVLEMNYEGEDYVIINNHFKCCGDGILDFSDNTDEEFRRYSAISLLKTYVDSNYSNKNVLILGDLNDLVEESFNNNVFVPIINDSVNYLIADKYIPYQNNVRNTSFTD